MNTTTPDGVEDLKRRILEAEAETQRLIREKKAQGAACDALNAERLRATIIEAAKVFGLSASLPRDYALVPGRGNNSDRAYLKRVVRGAMADIDPTQFALDIATGWLDEFNALLAARLAGRKPPVALPAAATAASAASPARQTR